jgi:hypothetical protein
VIILAVVFASLALSEDFKTTNGKVYKDATVSRIEGDGLVLKTETGISKVYFAELPQEVQERFHWAKPEEPREPFYSRWAAAAEDPAVLAKNDRYRDFCYRQRRACYRSYPFSTTAGTASKTRIATGSGSSCALRISSRLQLCDSRVADVSTNAVGVCAGFSAVVPVPRGRNFLFFPS